MSEIDDFVSSLKINIDAKDLKTHAYQLRKESGKGCALCDYHGYTINYKGQHAICACVKEKLLLDIYRVANVPNVYIGKTIEDWNTRTDGLGNDLGIQQTTSEHIYSLLKFYVKHLDNICSGGSPKIHHSNNVVNKLHSILFEGNIGSGKTFIASILVQEAIKKNLSSKYFEWSELVQAFTDFDKKDIADNIADDFRNLDFIAIDGIEYLNYNHPQLPFQLDRISKARLNSGKPIVLFTFGNISQIYGGSGWTSLIKNCLQVRLPYAIS